MYGRFYSKSEVSCYLLCYAHYRSSSIRKRHDWLDWTDYPHIGRILVGNDYRKLLPASFLLGGSFLVVTDNCARLLSTNEIPIGILTAFVGVPIFLYLILKKESNF